MTTSELIRLIDGPLAVYLSKGEYTCSFGRFVELLNEEFPELSISYEELFPRLFNMVLVPDVDEGEYIIHWAVEAVAKEYVSARV